MSKHTPGPWKATQMYVSAEESEDRLGFRIRVDNGNRYDNQANARLIAAAPDLLAALQGLRKSFHEYVGPNIEAADAAIAKATGEQI